MQTPPESRKDMPWVRKYSLPKRIDLAISVEHRRASVTIQGEVTHEMGVVRKKSK